MAPEPRLFYYGYQDILELVDKRTTKDLMMDFNRKGLDPEKLEDVIQYVAQYGTLGMRLKVGAAFMRDPDAIKKLQTAAPPRNRRRRNPPASPGDDDGPRGPKTLPARVPRR